MNNIIIGCQQFQEGIKEIRNMGGSVQKIYHNMIFFRQNNVEYVFVPEMTDGGFVFLKKSAKN